MPVLVRHPSPVTHRPPRARAARTGYACIETPVDLVAIDERRLNPENPWNRLRGLPGLPREVLELDGALWTPVLTDVPAGSASRRTLRPEELVRLLGSDPGTPWPAELAGPLGRTPFAAAWMRGPRRDRVAETSRGDDPDRLGTLLAQEPEATRAALSAFVAGEIAVGGDRVYRRAHPMARRNPGDANYPVGHCLTIDPDGILPVPVRADAYERAIAFWRDESGPWSGRLHPPWHPDALCDDADLGMLANAAPEAVLAWIRDSMAGLPDPAWLDPLRAWTARGRIGAVIGDAREAALRAVVIARTHLRQSHPRNRAGLSEWGGLDRLCDYLEGHALPRLHAIPGEDAEAVAALAP